MSESGLKNIVVFFTDQQRADTCGCYGQSLNITPNLDRLADEGVLYENAYTCQPVCGPARSAIQSGLYPTKTGCYKNGIALPQDIPTIAKSLGLKGYQTAYVGKWHLATTIGKFNYETNPIPESLRGGYQDYWAASDVLEFTSDGYGGHVFDKDNNKLEFNSYRVDAITDYAIDFLNNALRDKPFFLFLSHIEPHHQNNHKHYEGPIGSKTKFKDCPIPQDLSSIKKGDYREEYPDYLGAVESLDNNLGRIIEHLKQNNLYDDTIIIFTSDHGSHFKTRNMEYKRSCHDASIHIPLVVRGGKFLGGARDNRLASLIDLPATILSIADVTDFNTDGLDLGGEKLRDCAFIQISETQIGRAIRTHRYAYSVSGGKLIGLFKPSLKKYREEFLYDNMTDPHQQNNLIKSKEHKSIKEQLKAMLINQVKTIEGADIKITS